MKYVLFTLWGIILGFWWYDLLNTYLYGTHTCLTAFYAAVGFFFVVLFMWGYAIFHLAKYKRSCCWQCLTGEHKTCYLSNKAKLASANYFKRQNLNHNHISKPH